MEHRALGYFKDPWRHVSIATIDFRAGSHWREVGCAGELLKHKKYPRAKAGAQGRFEVSRIVLEICTPDMLNPVRMKVWG